MPRGVLPGRGPRPSARALQRQASRLQAGYVAYPLTLVRRVADIVEKDVRLRGWVPSAAKPDDASALMRQLSALGAPERPGVNTWRSVNTWQSRNGPGDTHSQLGGRLRV